MSQQRTRKSIAAEQGPRGRSTFKAARDQCPQMKQQCGDINGSVPLPDTHHKERNGSRSKIPKNLRNDLENALVGLCDVWFEEIKPHLVRNKIKLHVHGAGAASGAGDHRRLAADAPGCSHLDPASTAEVCELCQLLVNAANSIESAVSQAATAAPAAFINSQTSLHPETGNLLSPCRVHKAESPWMRRAPPQPDRSQQRVPRLCHTYGFPTNITKTKPERFVIEPPVLKDSNHHLHGRQIASSFPRANSHHTTSTTKLSKQIKCHVELQKPRVSHDGANFKTFQEAVLSVPTTGPFIQNNAKNTMRNPQKKRQSVPYQTHFPKHRQEIDQRQPCFRNTASNTSAKLKRSASTKSPTPYEQFAQDSKDQKHRRSRPTQEGQTISRCPVASTLHRHPSKTQLKLTKHNINFREEPAHQKPSLAATNICRPSLSRTQSRGQLHRDQKLFQDDLVDIIAERNKKHLEVLFKSPQRVESTSEMNLLYTGHAEAHRTKPYAKKTPPWR